MCNNEAKQDAAEILKHGTNEYEIILEIIEDLEKTQGEDSQKSGYALEKEKTIINLLRRGDASSAKKQLNELLAMLLFSYPDDFEFVKIRATELIVLISRVEAYASKTNNISLETAAQNLKQIQQAETVEDLSVLLHTAVDQAAGNNSSLQGVPHAAAMQKIKDFILENFTRKVSLKEISYMAGFSAPYFSTIFREEMGENLSKYINRLRVEKAGRLLLETKLSLSEIAALCCFEDQSWFSKIFKSFTGISPGKYRNQGGFLNLS